MGNGDGDGAGDGENDGVKRNLLEDLVDGLWRIGKPRDHRLEHGT